MNTKWNVFVECSNEWHPHGMRGKALQSLFQTKLRMAGPTIAEFVQQYDIGVSIATSSTDEDTAQAIKMLRRSVTLWVVVPDEIGYWANRANASHVAQKIELVLAWAAYHGIDVNRIGLDFEYQVRMVSALNTASPVKFMIALFKYARNREKAAQDVIQHAVAQALVPAEYYVFPGFLGRIMGGGLTPPEGSRQIEMLYTSMVPKTLRGWLLGQRTTDAIPAFGLVNSNEGETPGRMLGKSLPNHLSYKDFKDDVTALGTPAEAYVFALNGVRPLNYIESISRL